MIYHWLMSVNVFWFLGSQKRKRHWKASKRHIPLGESNQSFIIIFANIIFGASIYKVVYLNFSVQQMKRYSALSCNVTVRIE